MVKKTLKNKSPKAISTFDDNKVKLSELEIVLEKNSNWLLKCKELSIFNCYQRNNPCYINAKSFKCDYDHDLEEQLKESIANKKETLTCPFGTYLKQYRGNDYCSKKPYQNNELAPNVLSSAFQSENANNRLFSYNLKYFKDLYYDLQENTITSYILKKLKTNIKAILLSSFNTIVTLGIAYYCNNFHKLTYPTFRFKGFFNIEIKQKKFLELHEFIYRTIKRSTNYYLKEKNKIVNTLTKKNKKTLFSRIKDNIDKENEKYANLIGIMGAQEEEIFRDTLLLVLNTYIKPFLEEQLPKYLKNDQNLEKNITNIYCIFEIFVSSCTFGFAHLINLSWNENKRGVYCQVLYATVSGIYLSIIRNYSQNLYLSWLIHFYHNFHVSI